MTFDINPVQVTDTVEASSNTTAPIISLCKDAQQLIFASTEIEKNHIKLIGTLALGYITHNQFVNIYRSSEVQIRKLSCLCHPKALEQWEQSSEKFLKEIFLYCDE
jgi:hypothetical protein